MKWIVIVIPNAKTVVSIFNWSPNHISGSTVVIKRKTNAGKRIVVMKIVRVLRKTVFDISAVTWASTLNLNMIKMVILKRNMTTDHHARRSRISEAIGEKHGGLGGHEPWHGGLPGVADSTGGLRG